MLLPYIEILDRIQYEIATKNMLEFIAVQSMYLLNTQ